MIADTQADGARSQAAELWPDFSQDERSLTVKVLFTSESGTRAALGPAARLAAELHAPLKLVVLQVVPRPLEPERSPVAIEFLQERARRLASCVQIQIEVDVCLCRSEREALSEIFAPEDLVFVGNGKGWRDGRAKRLGKELQRLGLKVAYA